MWKMQLNRDLEQKQDRIARCKAMDRQPLKQETCFSCVLSDGWYGVIIILY